MATEGALYRLMSWLSPAYPVGAYAFSHGIENAVETGAITDRPTAGDWIESIVTDGNGFADLVFASAAWEFAGHEARLGDVNAFALAFQPTAELYTESTAQGRAFLSVTAEAWECTAIATLQRMARRDIAYPVAVGAVARSHGIDGGELLTAYGHAYAANLVSAAVRLVPLGQTDGQRLTAALLPAVEAAAQRAAGIAYTDVSTSTPMVDIASMNHESQYVRLFRS